MKCQEKMGSRVEKLRHERVALFQPAHGLGIHEVPRDCVCQSSISPSSVPPHELFPKPKFTRLQLKVKTRHPNQKTARGTKFKTCSSVRLERTHGQYVAYSQEIYIAVSSLESEKISQTGSWMLQQKC